MGFYITKKRGGSNLESTKLIEPTVYNIVKGFFVQENEGFNPKASILLPSFGLKNTSSDRWIILIDHINKLNSSSNDNVVYKLFFIARHGEGVHNVAEAKYGTPAWDSYWSLLNGDGESVWGPDPALTKLGEKDVLNVNAVWKFERLAGIPIPSSFYTSPMQRASKTLQLTWDDIQLDKGILPLIMEDLRECIGTHTCDQRSTKSQIAACHPNWLFNSGFTEMDELFKPPKEETEPELDIRTRRVLDHIFKTDPSPCISITAHGGNIRSIFRVANNKEFQPLPGGVVPIILRAEGKASAKASAK